MTEKKNGGFAFPMQTFERDEARGMTLRDWFAGKVLGQVTLMSTLTQREIARYAYEIADAMIERREK